MTNLGKLTGFKSAFVDSASTCHIGCRFCDLGGLYRPLHKNMPIQMLTPEIAKVCFSRIVNEFKVTEINFGNYCEPFLNPNVTDLFDLARSSGAATVGVSTSFSIQRDLTSIIKSGVTSFWASLSGMTPEVYNQVHTNGDIKLVLSNLQELASLAKKRKLQIVCRYHVYKHNVHQTKLFKDFCTRIGIIPNFSLGHLGGVAMGLKWLRKEFSPEMMSYIEDRIHLDLLQNTVVARECSYRKILPIFVDGTLQHCCAWLDYDYTIDFMTATEQQIFDFKRNYNPMCEECLQSGLAFYFCTPKRKEVNTILQSIDQS